MTRFAPSGSGAMVWLGAAFVLGALACEEGDSELIAVGGTGPTAGGAGGTPCTVVFVGESLLCVPAEEAAKDSVMIAPLEQPRAVPAGPWRGFNLVGMYALQWPDTNRGFQEQAFRAMSDLGFNTARLPVDYRTYTKQSDWLSFDAATIGGLDRAIGWAQVYGIHVNLCTHRAPGYCVHDYAGRIVDLPEAQDLDLWSDPVAQDAFVEHWTLLARRYQKIPPQYLSFNLINEPWNVDQATYVALMIRTIQAIREVSPERTIVVDGLETANVPITDPSFLALENVVQSKHAYDFPKFQWFSTPYNPGSEAWPVPRWPPTLVASYLYGPYQATNVDTSPLVIDGAFPAGTRVTLHVNDVNVGARLVIRSDRETLVDAALTQDSNPSGWAVVAVYDNQDVWGKKYDQDFSATLTQAATELVFAVTELNFLDFTQLSLEVLGRTYTFAPVASWGIPQAHFELNGETLQLVACPPGAEKYYDLDLYLSEWKALAQQGVPVMIGEFNQSNLTPYEDAYRFNEFLLSTFKSAGFGWAFWDFDSTNPAFGGAFIDNERPGATYADYEGYQIDWRMAALFQAY